jgi:hypothetical protein
MGTSRCRRQRGQVDTMNVGTATTACNRIRNHHCHLRKGLHNPIASNVVCAPIICHYTLLFRQFVRVR